MQMGQVPTMFVPEGTNNDMRSVTVEDDMSTMFPEPRDFSVTETPLVENPQTWVLGALAIFALWWILRK